MKFTATNKAATSGTYIVSCVVRDDGVIIEMSKTVKVDGESVRIQVVHAYRRNGYHVDAYEVTNCENGPDYYYYQRPEVYLPFTSIAEGFENMSFCERMIKIGEIEVPSKDIYIENGNQKFTLNRIGNHGPSIQACEVFNEWDVELARYRHKNGVILVEFDCDGKPIK